ncbi:hypothetical protein MMC06_003338 [Schaereria dolodes]|nr:hypothetical protein [Schaereria dolodes]
MPLHLKSFPEANTIGSMTRKIEQRSNRKETSRLLLLPNELIQTIYLHCLEINMPRASPALGAALSSDVVFNLAILHAFWNRNATQSSEDTMGPNIRELFAPSEPNNMKEEEQARMQDTLLQYDWCTFGRLKRCFSLLMEAIMKDLLWKLAVPLQDDDEDRMKSLIKNLPERNTDFTAAGLDAPNTHYFNLNYRHRLSAACLLTYHHLNSPFDPRIIPSIGIYPVQVFTMPERYMQGRPWTDDRIDLFRMLSSGPWRDIPYSKTAFHEGIKNAILEQNIAALLVLAWRADEFSRRSMRVLTSSENLPYEPSGELFRLAALTQVKRGDSICDDDAISASISLFKLLIRLHAESMPRDDPDITAWASQLLTWNGGTDCDRMFGQWVLDCKEHMEPEYRRTKGERHHYYAKPEDIPIRRLPMFFSGTGSPHRSADVMLRRFIQIEGTVDLFEREVERAFPPYR